MKSSIQLKYRNYAGFSYLNCYNVNNSGLIYSYDIYVQNLFPLKGTGGKVLRGILVVGFLFLLNVLPRFTADLWSSETLEILRVPNLIYLPLILAAWLVSRWGYLRFSQYVERINL